jgi:hypothetical protein
MPITLRATPNPALPQWAILERQLIAELERAVYPFMEKYTRPDNGWLIWRSEGRDNWHNRDGADDFYEAFYNWPLLYLLGGSDQLLQLGHRQWEAVTQQLTALGMVENEYDLGYDQFHIGEGNLLFYFLCLADPTNPVLIERACRFANFYLGDNSATPNYDPLRRLVRAPHTGSGGPRWGYQDGEALFPWAAGMAIYGLPYDDVEGIRNYDDLKNPKLAQLMGEVMHERMGKGDVVMNLIVTSLMTNAYLLTGEVKYRQWVLDYVDAWQERAQQNNGLLPDNIGLSGQIGEYMNGRWYGGLYGWTWPHGLHNVGAAAVIAAANALLLTKNTDYLGLPRRQLDYLIALGRFEAQQNDELTFVVPHRYKTEGWFDYRPLALTYPTALWSLSRDEADWQRIEDLRAKSQQDWNAVRAFRLKTDSGHEQPWLRFLAGANPTYPEQILRQQLEQVRQQLKLIEQDRADLLQVDVHHWQRHNPIVTEGLVQLTLGTPQHIYYGGLLYAPIRYFDAEKGRPGLPSDVAALVEQITVDGLVLSLVNTGKRLTRYVMLQAGVFGEHCFEQVRYNAVSQAVNDRVLTVELPPYGQIRLELAMTFFVNQPAYLAAHQNLAVVGT